MKIRQFLILAAALAYGALGAADLSITFQTSSKGLGSGSGTEMHYYTSRYQLSRNEKTGRTT
jgi:hypothetical protein